LSKFGTGNVHDKKFQQTMYKLFNTRNPGIKIEYSSISNTVYDQTLEAALVAKQVPGHLHAFRQTFLQLSQIAKQIMPLNDIAPSQSELQKWMAAFPPFSASSLKERTCSTERYTRLIFRVNRTLQAFPCFTTRRCSRKPE